MSQSAISFKTFNGSENGSIQQKTVSKPALTGEQVYLRITASGLCGTDLHYLKADQALGHEGVGVVEQVGPSVKSLEVGDRVGWGYVHDACGLCHQCLRGAEQHCAERQLYSSADLEQGSIGTGAVWKESFLFKVPDNISDTDAAPLMCAGATVFSALQYVTSNSHVGIVGIGGLGHLAIQFAAKMGCRTTVFSGTESKKEEASQLGATDFVATKGKDKLDIGSQKLDALLVCTSVVPNFKLFFDIMAPEGVILPLSVSNDEFKINYMTLITGGLHIQGSLVASRHVHNQMLQFAALHNIKPIVQKYKMDQAGVEKCVHDLTEGNMRYRGVLVPKAAR